MKSGVLTLDHQGVLFMYQVLEPLLSGVSWSRPSKPGETTDGPLVGSLPVGTWPPPLRCVPVNWVGGARAPWRHPPCALAVWACVLRWRLDSFRGDAVFSPPWFFRPSSAPVGSPLDQQLTWALCRDTTSTGRRWLSRPSSPGRLCPPPSAKRGGTVQPVCVSS